MTNPTTALRYRSGEDVMRGDAVITGNRKHGVVTIVIAPGSPESAAYACPNGGVLIEEDWDGVKSFLSIASDAEECWDDLEFVAREHTDSP